MQHAYRRTNDKSLTGRVAPLATLSVRICGSVHERRPSPSTAGLKSNVLRPDEEVKAGLVAALPALRAFARSLCLDPHRADDLVQETALKAWSSRDQFARGTNLQAWLFTILRNTFFSERRRMKREVEDPEGRLAGEIAIPPPQDGALDGVAFRSAFARLTPLQREILILVGAEGRSYAETAEICGIRLGTVKSRIHRARIQLATCMVVGLAEIVSSRPSHS